MARYKLLAPAYINERLYTQPEIDKVDKDGNPIPIFVEFAGEVRPGVDTHLELVKTPENKKQAEADALVFQNTDRAAAISFQLTEDGKPGTKPIDDKTPIDLVRTRLAIFKQNPAV